MGLVTKTPHSLVPRHDIGGHGAVGVPDVEIGGRIIDGGRDVKCPFAHVSASYHDVTYIFITVHEKSQL